MPEIYSARARKARRPTAMSHSSQSPQKKEAESSSSPHELEHRHVDQYSLVMKREHEGRNPFSAYSPKPRHVRFETQSDREHVILALRRHPITNLPWILIALVMSLAPLLLQLIPVANIIPARVEVVIVIGWYLLIVGYILESFLSWFFNVNIITDERIVDIDFHSLISKRISSAKIDNIEDVSGETVGFLRSILNFGTVVVQTAGETKEFEFIDVPHPDRIVQLLNELILEEEREKLEGRVN